MDPQVIPARTALNMATLGGAQAIGLDKEIGALTAGRRADLIQVSLADLHFTPMYDVISHLVYVAHERDVTTVVVDGKVLMRDGKVLTVDQQRVRSEATAIADRIRGALADTTKSPQAR
jgi:5-methylthioadenosine/S-adenosylhomocysteine deaminase